MRSNDSCFQINKLNFSFGIDNFHDSFIAIAHLTQDVKDPLKIIPKEGDYDPDPCISTETSFDLDIPLMEMSDSDIESSFDLFILPSENEDSCMFSPIMSKIVFTPDLSPNKIGYDSWDELSIPDDTA